MLYPSIAYCISVSSALHTHLESIVSAQPSTAMSCVAARKLRAKNIAVRSVTLGGGAPGGGGVSPPSPRRLSKEYERTNMNKPVTQRTSLSISRNNINIRSTTQVYYAYRYYVKYINDNNNVYTK